MSSSPQEAPHVDGYELGELRRLAKRRAERWALEHEGWVPVDRYFEEVEALVESQLAVLLPVYADARTVAEPLSLRWRERSRMASAWILGTFLIGVPAAMAMGPDRYQYLKFIGSALAVALGFVGIPIMWGRRRERRFRIQESRRTAGGSVRKSQFEQLLEQVVLAPAMTQAIAVEWGDPATERVAFSDGAELSSTSQPRQVISTEAGRRLAIALSRRFGSAVGLAGARGAGKTELARSVSVGAQEPTVGVFMPAPVTYDSKQFLLRLLKEVCLRVLEGADHRRLDDQALRTIRQRRVIFGVQAIVVGAGFGIIVGYVIDVDIRKLEISKLYAGAALAILGAAFPVIARPFTVRHRLNSKHLHADRVLRAIEFTETSTSNAEGGLTFHGLAAKRARGVSLVRTSFSEIDIAREFDDLVQSIAAAGGAVIVAIDELDKMPSDDAAVEFLNQVKVLFGVRNCSFVVSVSESAWARFEQRGLPFRDAFDSSLDEVISVAVLRPAESRDLLRRRSSSITDLQCLFCHCLSGGVPRDLLRYARLLAQAADRAGDRHLAPVIAALLADELERKVSAAELRIRTIDPNRVSPSTMDEAGAWRNVWRARDTQRFLARRSAPDEAIPDDLRYQLKATLDDLAGIVAVFDTAREAFSPEMSARLAQSPGFEGRLMAGYDGIARARFRLSIDTGSADAILSDARRSIGLGPATLVQTTRVDANGEPK